MRVNKECESVEHQAVLDKSTTGNKRIASPAKENHILKCTRPLFVATLNVNTLNSEMKLGEITSLSGARNICTEHSRIPHLPREHQHLSPQNGQRSDATYIICGKSL